MSTQLDILALEPFYGGSRRNMLETVIRCSRHRWTLLKLPPRRMERRLSVAANWFAEQLSRHWAGRHDLLFTSEAMNLASLYRLAPALARQPSVVYFHENQLLRPRVASHPGRRWKHNGAAGHDGSMRKSAGGRGEDSAAVVAARDIDLELVNLNTATAASEIWFNSSWHLKSFMAAADELVERHPELSSHSPMPEVQSRAHLMPPPIDLNLVPHVKATGRVSAKDPRAVFVDTRDGDLRTLNAALAELASRGEKFRLITVGPVKDLSDHWPRRTISENDDLSHVLGLLEAGVVLSVRPGAAADLQVVRGLQAGCRPVLPDSGVYPELIPQPLHEQCLNSFTVDALADAIQEAVHPVMDWTPPDYRPMLRPFEAIAATRLFDERLSQLAATHGRV